MAIDWAGSAVSTDIVQQEMFGTNMLFDRDQVGPGGTFDDSMRALGIQDVRFPGGSITEWYFDINNPDATIVWAPDRNAWREVMPLTEFLTWAGAHDVGVNLVVPTGSLLQEGALGERKVKESAEDDLYRYFTDVLQGVYGDAEIDTFEIGNEYWLGAEMTHVEYARIANLMAETAQRAIDDHRVREGLGAEWSEPEISYQVGQYGRYSTDPGWIQNQQLIDWLTPEAAEAIDAVVVHYYSRGSYDDLPNQRYFFDRLESWTADPRLTDVAFHVTEWNVNNQLSEELGLKQASALWYKFSEMVMYGVDAAHVWPIQQNNRTNLSGDEGQVDLTIAGEAFRLLSDALVGTELTRRTEWEDGTAWLYEGEGAAHLYVASRSDITTSVTVDRRDLGLDDLTWWKTILGTAGAVDNHKADPVLHVRADTRADQDLITFELDPYEVVRATFYDPLLPASPGSAFPDPLLGGVYHDTIVASDAPTRIEAGNGRDTLTGGAASDTLYGEGGADVASGQGGADRMSGGTGDDRLDGGTGNDRISGGSGADTLIGGAGADELWGDSGHDLLDGGAGDDTLFAGAGDTLQGALGNDVFVIAPPGSAALEPSWLPALPTQSDPLWT